MCIDIDDDKQKDIYMIRIHSQKPPVLIAAEQRGFKTFTSQDYDMNIIACRNPEPRSDHFDDLIHIVYVVEGRYYEHIYPCTCDAGKYWLENPMRASGTAVLKSPHQYRSAFTFGLHRGLYKCVVQRKTIEV